MKITVGKSMDSNILFFISYGIYLILSILSTSFYTMYIDSILKFGLIFCGVLITLNEVINILASNQLLPAKYRNHLLEPKSNRNMGMSYTA